MTHVDRALTELEDDLARVRQTLDEFEASIDGSTWRTLMLARQLTVQAARAEAAARRALRGERAEP